jgi:hypothetical protein
MKITFTSFLGSVFCWLAINPQLVAGDISSTNATVDKTIYQQHQEQYQNLPFEVREIISSKRGDCFNTLLHYYEQWCQLSLEELRNYKNMIEKIVPKDTLSEIEEEAKEVKTGLSNKTMSDAQNQERNSLCGVMRNPKTEHATHQTLTNAYVLSLRYFADDQNMLEYIARIVYRTRSSPQLIITLIDEKTTPNEFSKQLFGTDLVEICNAKQDGKTFINDAQLHKKFRDIFLTVLIKDGKIPLYLFPTKTIPQATAVSPNKNEILHKHQYQGRITDYISLKRRIQYDINSAQKQFALIEFEGAPRKVVRHIAKKDGNSTQIVKRLVEIKNTANSTMNQWKKIHYFIDEKLANTTIENSRASTMYEENKKLLITIHRNKNFTHQLLINNEQYTYEEPTTAEGKNKHIVLSYFLHHQTKVCDDNHSSGKKFYNDVDRTTYNQSVRKLKVLFSTDQQLKPYLEQVNTVSNYVYLNAFKTGLGKILTGTHAALTAISAISHYYGLLGVFPRVLNPWHVLSGLFIWRLSSCVVTHSYHKLNLDINNRWPMWIKIPLIISSIVIAGPEHINSWQFFGSWQLNRDVNIDITHLSN